MRMMSIILCNTSSAAHSRATGSSSLGAMHILLSISDHEEKRFECHRRLRGRVTAGPAVRLRVGPWPASGGRQAAATCGTLGRDLGREHWAVT
jgi:hypothetical protein